MSRTKTSKYLEKGGIIKVNKIIKKFMRDLNKDKNLTEKLNKSKIDNDRIRMLNISFLNYLLGGPSGFSGLKIKDIYEDCEFLDDKDYETIMKYFYDALIYFNMKDEIDYIKKKIELIK